MPPRVKLTASDINEASHFFGNEYMLFDIIYKPTGNDIAKIAIIIILRVVGILVSLYSRKIKLNRRTLFRED